MALRLGNITRNEAVKRLDGRLAEWHIAMLTAGLQVAVQRVLKGHRTSGERSYRREHDLASSLRCSVVDSSCFVDELAVAALRSKRIGHALEAGTVGALSRSSTRLGQRRLAAVRERLSERDIALVRSVTN